MGILEGTGQRICKVLLEGNADDGLFNLKLSKKRVKIRGPTGKKSSEFASERFMGWEALWPG